MNLLPMEDIPAVLAKFFNGKETKELKVVHHFSDGICVRELHMSAGDVAVGALHKTNHLTFLSKGSIQLRIGEESKLIHAPCTFEALAGSRKIALAYTDCVISNIIPTHLTDIEEIEKMFTTLHQDKKELKCLQQS